MIQAKDNMKDYFFLFNVSINSGEAQVIKTKLSLYHLAAIEAVKTLPFKESDSAVVDVKIWQEGLVSKFGKLNYLVRDGKAELKRI